MPALREALSGAGYSAVSTYLQSGNVVLCSDRAPTELEQDCERLIAERFGLEVPVLARTASELAEIVSADPLGELAADPRRYQVTFLAEPLPAGRVEELAALAAGQERLEALGRELFAWHPDGQARSKLAAALAAASLGVKASARNWTTVTTLAQMTRA